MTKYLIAQSLSACFAKSPGISQVPASGFFAVWVSAILLLNGCNGITKPAATTPQSSEIPATSKQVVKAEMGSWGVETQYIAKDIRPGDDFYRYVNKGWLDTTKIPQGLPGIDSFSELGQKTDKKIAGIIQEALANQAAIGTPEQQIADFYTSYVDIKGRNARGFDTLKSGLAETLQIHDRSGIAERMGRVGYFSLFKTKITINVNDPQHYIVEMDQSGLGMPGTDYYLEKKQPYIGHRSAYQAYIEGVFNRAGIANAKFRAKAVLDFEAKIAKLHWSVEQRRNPVKNNHVMSKDELVSFAPGFDWKSFLNANGYEGGDYLKVCSDTAIKSLAALFQKTPVGTLRDYVAFHYLNNYAPLMSDEWSDAHFDFFSRRLHGIEQPSPLEERAVKWMNENFGEPIGKLYVQRYFSSESKAKAEEMIGFIMQSMKQHLEQQDWMDEPTRQAALSKLASFKVKTGYPEHWHDYSTLRISKDDLVTNVMQLNQWQRLDDQAKLKGSLRPGDWPIQPQEVNADYAPERNRIVFPAGILQAPFFDPNADPAVNFGSIGVVIGHEIGHGFDDQGSQSDGEGKLRNWWTKTAAKNFKAKTDRLVAQYNAYVPMEGLHVNGQLTLGENIGDMSGVAVAYTAYQKYVAAKYPNATPPVLDGYTGNQRFFLGFAQIWRNHWADEILRMIVLTNEHSPGEYRVNGVLTNFTPWYEAYGVKENDALYLSQKNRITIW